MFILLENIFFVGLLMIPLVMYLEPRIKLFYGRIFAPAILYTIIVRLILLISGIQVILLESPRGYLAFTYMEIKRG